MDRAINALVGREYRKQVNREAVAVAMLNDTQNQASDDGAGNTPTAPTEEPQDDWLNVFERYAEDASSEQLQDLWGRVLSVEIRRPGRFSMRTLRLLSEFSQADALIFETFAKYAFGESAPKKLVYPNESTDI